ncbi:MAG: NAD(P)H-hydrate dehydratase [Mariprofundales bacterium]|nr:NAD(P)H-hydrate dehydratase [Mariprofundales bacterium]
MMQEITRCGVAEMLPQWDADAHKQTLGHLWIFGGSVGYSGAPTLAAMGAQSMRVGLVSLAVPASIYPLVASASLEVMVHPQQQASWQGADAVVAGPGWGRNQQLCLAQLLEISQPLLLDADALNMVADSAGLRSQLRARSAVTLVTPHAGEAARLLDCDAGEVQCDRRRALDCLVERFACHVLLKGAGSLVGAPNGARWYSPFGSNRLATAGSGDVLAGVAGALLAQGVAAENALVAAVALHGLAGEKTGWYRAGALPDLIFGLAEAMRMGDESG